MASIPEAGAVARRLAILALVVLGGAAQAGLFDDDAKEG